MEQDVEEMEASLRAMMEEKKEVAEDAKQLLERVEGITAQLADREEAFSSQSTSYLLKHWLSIVNCYIYFSEVRKQVEKIVKEETKLKMEKIDVDEKMAAFNKKLSEHKGVIRSYQAKVRH